MLFPNNLQPLNTIIFKLYLKLYILKNTFPMQSIFIRSNFPNIVTQKQETCSKTTLVVPSCVECFILLFLPKCRNAETSSMFHAPLQCHHAQNVSCCYFYLNIETQKRATCSMPPLVVSSCVECFMLLFLSICRKAETSNMFRSKPTEGSVCGGICCSFPLFQLRI